MSSPAADGDFDDFVDELGGFGKYQKRLLYLLLCPLFLIMPMPMMHQVFVLHVPHHECSPPANFSAKTLEMNQTAWKDIFLPVEFSAYTFTNESSVCNYFSYEEQDLEYIKDNWADIVHDASVLTGLQERAETVACSQWEYDTSEFTDTAATENNWVCNDAMVVADLYTLSVVGLILGTFIFSAFADFFGRKLCFYIGTATCIVFTLCMIPTSHNYHLFAFFKVASAFGMLPLFQSPMNILCEISNISKRGFVICVICVAWSLGQILFPLIGWLVASWKIMKVVSVAPLALFFFSWTLLPESPRWLISKGRTKEAGVIMRKIAETNNVPAPPDLASRLAKLSAATQEQSLGYISLFAKPTLALRTILCTIGFTASAFIYYQMMINVQNMAGNTFLNLFLLGLVEGPGNLMGVVLANKLGRRWTHSGLLGVNTLVLALLMGLVLYQGTETWAGPLISFLCMLVKMNISATFVVAYIQAMEVFPTCVRQSGIGFCSFISQMISIGGPYAVALGSVDLRLPYLVLFLICLTGSLATSFLPETVGAKLPETLQEANTFGQRDKYFSFKPPRTEKYQQPAEQKL